MSYIERFEDAFLARRAQRPPARSLAFTEAGLVLGAATVLAPMRRGGDALDLSGEDRILALLAAAFSAPVDAAVLGKLRRAAELWAHGDKSLGKSIWSICACRNSQARNRPSGSFSPIT